MAKERRPFRVRSRRAPEAATGAGWTRRLAMDKCGHESRNCGGGGQKWSDAALQGSKADKKRGTRASAGLVAACA
eukprot:15470307-Alexandrium_andersonii.AAC.1